MSTLKYFIKNIDKITDLTMEHIELISLAMCFALIIWISIGILIRNHNKLANGLLGVASIIMSIPSISIYGILVTIPGFGLSRLSAVFALVLYAMLPIMRNVYLALNEVDESIIEAARGMGMKKNQILWKIQLPLAFPIIFAGVRVALVMMVGIATLAVYIGERNLGRLIQQGITRTHMDMVLTGGLLVAILAIVVDGVMALIQKKLISPGLHLDS
ncbi:ABC transporter permease [Clostridiaceae bacterium HSG29]|nr:ABC transporter permease [Clostridiaceae bacterium HSG29]